MLPIWKKWLDAKTLVITPNSDVIYAMSYLDLGKDGSIVFEAPPGLQGILLDFWQRPIPGDDLGVELRTFHGEPDPPLDQHIFPVRVRTRPAGSRRGSETSRCQDEPEAAVEVGRAGFDARPEGRRLLTAEADRDRVDQVLMRRCSSSA